MPDEELLRFELRRAVEAAVRELPEIYREPVILRDFEGLTTEEASTRLKVKDQTLKSRLHRGRCCFANVSRPLHRASRCIARRPRIRNSRLLRRNELGPRAPIGERRGQFQREPCDLARSRGIDLLPVVTGAVIVGVEPSEEVDGGNPAGR